MGCTCAKAAVQSEDFDDLEEYYRGAEAVGSHLCVRNIKVVVKRSHGQYVSINNFKIIRQLGEGRYGEVYLCRNQHRKDGLRGLSWGSCLKKDDDNVENDETFAMKVVRRQQNTSREYKILMKVHHPHIVNLVEFIDDSTNPYIYLVFENLGGGAIATCSKEGFLEISPWEEDKAVPLFLQIVDALMHLHARGVFHRDIKPENVVFTSAEKNSVKLIDFGESRMLQSGCGLHEAASRCTKGTPFFMACEALSGDHFPDREGDTWATGVLFYLLLIGHVPFGYGEVSLIALHECIRSQELVIPDVSDEAQDVLGGMLDRDLSRRYTLPYVARHPWMTGAQMTATDCALTETSSATPTASRQSSVRMRPESLSTNPLVPAYRRGSPGLKALQIDNESQRNTESLNQTICKTPLSSDKEQSCRSQLGFMLRGATLRLLICDDQPQVRQQLMKFLAKAKVATVEFEFYEVHTCEAALEEIINHSKEGTPFDLVIMDVFPYASSRQSGIDTVAALRAMEEEEDLPRTSVLLSTTQAEAPAFLEEQADRVGANVIVKPFHPQQAYGMLKALGIRYRELLPEEVNGIARETHIADKHFLGNAMTRSVSGWSLSSPIQLSQNFDSPMVEFPEELISHPDSPTAHSVSASPRKRNRFPSQSKVSKSRSVSPQQSDTLEV